MNGICERNTHSTQIRPVPLACVSTDDSGRPPWAVVAAEDGGVLSRFHFKNARLGLAGGDTDGAIDFLDRDSLIVFRTIDTRTVSMKIHRVLERIKHPVIREPRILVRVDVAEITLS